MANVPISNLTATWNNVSTAFNGIKLNVTDTASAAASLLMDLQVGGSSKLSIDKTGAIKSPGSVNIYGVGNSAVTINSNALDAAFGNNATVFYKPVQLENVLRFTSDTILARDAANTLAQRNGVNAQTHRIYGTYTDGSNYRRLTKTMSTGGVAEIKPEGAGTGASGNVLHISGLPTSNPGPGILWNNLGIVNVGT